MIAIFIIAYVSTCLAKNAIRVVVNDVKTYSDYRNRLLHTLDYLNYEYESHLYDENATSSSYDHWYAENMKQILENHSDVEDYFLIFNKAYAIVTKPASEILKVKSSLPGYFVIPHRSCTENKEKGVCFLDEYNKTTPVIFGRVDELNKFFSNYDLHENFEVYIESELKNKSYIKTDEEQSIFEVVKDIYNESVVFKDGVYTIKDPKPIILAGTDPRSKCALNYVSNYIKIPGLFYNISTGTNASLNQPEIMMAIFIEYPTPFLDLFFDKIFNLMYPKKKMTLLVHNNVEFHNDVVTNFLDKAKGKYKSLKYISFKEDITEKEARVASLKECQAEKYAFFFSVDSTAHLENPNIITELMQLNRSIIAPMIHRPYTFWTNFWGAVSPSGYYERSPDYMEIVKRAVLGTWNVPHVSECYLVSRDILEKITFVKYALDLDFDLAFSKALRDENIFLYVTNVIVSGRLSDGTKYNTSLPRPDLYEMFSNYDLWTEKYIHEDYWSRFNNVTDLDSPAPDVFWFPIVSKQFCDDMIATVKGFNLWSGGKHNDSRLPGGYENVPTDDTHMTQIGFEERWMLFLRNFVQPIQRKAFEGYISDPPRAPLSFVVRYTPDVQDRLKPHHDASTYTINIALNEPAKDYSGGGVHFIRQNTIIKDLRVGWALMHPGRLTHIHEGLRTTSGTRYIMVSFIDP